MGITQATTPLEALQDEFREELRAILIDAAKRMNCHPEELMCNADENGVIEVRKIPHEAIIGRKDAFDIES